MLSFITALIIDGTPELVDLERLSKILGRSWEAARRVEFEEEEIIELDHEYKGYANKAYQMLCQWKTEEVVQKQLTKSCIMLS